MTFNSDFLMLNREKIMHLTSMDPLSKNSHVTRINKIITILVISGLPLQLQIMSTVPL